MKVRSGPLRLMSHRRQRAHGGFHLVIARAGQRFEIVPARKNFRRGAHGGEIERAADVPGLCGAGADSSRRRSRRSSGIACPWRRSGRRNPARQRVTAMMRISRGKIGVDGQRQLWTAAFCNSSSESPPARPCPGHARPCRCGWNCAGGGVGENLGDRLLDALLHAESSLLRLPAGVMRRRHRRWSV